MTRAWHRSMKQLVIWRMAMTSPRDRNGFEHGPCGVPVRGGGRLNGPFPLVGWLVLLLCLYSRAPSTAPHRPSYGYVSYQCLFCMHRLCVVVVVSFIYSSLPLKLSGWSSQWVVALTNSRDGTPQPMTGRCSVEQGGGGPFVVVVVACFGSSQLLHLVTGLVFVLPIGRQTGWLVNETVVTCQQLLSYSMALASGERFSVVAGISTAYLISF